MDYSQLKKAIVRLGEMLNAYLDETSKRGNLEKEGIQDSLVKRFEYAIEMSWKTCKRHLSEEGFAEAKTGSPKSIIRLAAEAGIIADAQSWIVFINARQSTSHDYSEEKADKVLNVVEGFYNAAKELYESLTGEELV